MLDSLPLAALLLFGLDLEAGFPSGSPGGGW